MRVSKQEMARHRGEIVAAASRMLRQKGIQGVSVAEIMKAAGLTHGGFYRHFSSKEALVAEATIATFNSFSRKFEASDNQEHALKDYVQTYLSLAHIDTPEQGCPIAAYGSEIAREGTEIRAAYSLGLTHMLNLIGGGLTCQENQRAQQARELLSLMCGAVIAARASPDTTLTNEILVAARHRAAKLISIG